MTHKPYWFKRKRYGFGWTPATKEGWIVISIYLALVFGGSALLTSNPKDLAGAAAFTAFMVVATIGLIIITYIKGPHPKWRWGKDENHNPVEDI